MGGFTFTSFQDEGDAFPSCIFDVGDSCAEGCTARVLGDGVIILIAWLLAIL